MKVVPLCFSLSTVMWPSWSFIISYTINRPRPIPLPWGFVVKNGLNMSLSTSFSIPSPLSLILHMSHFPLRPCVGTSEARVSLCVAIVIVPVLSPMASTAFLMRLMNTWQSLGVFPLIRLVCAPYSLIMVILFVLY